MGIQPQTFARRRARLAARVGEGLLLIPGSNATPLNIPINTTFRQNGHFLYLTGLNVPGGALLGDPDTGEWELLLPTPPDGDEIWHGPTPSPQALGEAAGLTAVYDRGLLEERVEARRKGRPLLAMPAPDGDWQRQLWKLGARDHLQGRLKREIHHPLADALVAMRLIKDAEEIEELERAAALTTRVHAHLMAATRPGVSELELRAVAEGVITAAGSRTSYDPIVTTRGDILHGRPGPSRLVEGQLLLADVGADSPMGYASDVTRTWPVSGRFTPAQRQIYDVVLTAQQAAISAIRPGVRFRDLHLLACRCLAQGLVELGLLKGEAAELVEMDAHALLFPHGLGHLLGLDVHDLEDLGDRAGYAPGWERSDRFGLAWLRLDRPLEPGMVVTIEPGLYFIKALLYDPEREARYRPWVHWDRLRALGDLGGIRIEDDVLVTDGGAYTLTDAIPRAPEALEAAVGVGSSPFTI